ncbi:MFS transporter [Halalkalirubrum salinum]|uniref:MFS transporter n=1 Tax=Halalkalirubrum salinum TaxID=2563889 RepID=UPI001484CD89|nr:MFS transporter [Halalkalirubrum salinum]
MVSGVGQTIAGLRGEGRGWMILTIAFGWFLITGTMLALPALLPRIISEFSVSNATAGTAITLLWLVYGIAQFPAGLLTDRLGERKMLFWSMTIGVLVAMWFTFSSSFTVFLVACGLLGIVGGLFATPRITLLSQLYPDRIGTAIGAVMAAGNIGSAVLPIVVGFVATVLGWRLGFGTIIPLFLIAVIAVWFVIPGKTDAGDAAPDTPIREVITPLLQEVTSREVVLVTAGITLTFFTFQGLTAFLTTYLISMKGLDGGTAALLYGMMFAVAAIAQPIAGSIADYLGKRLILTLITGSYAVLLVVLVVTNSFVVVVPMVLLLGTQRGATPVATAYLIATLPEDIQGTGYGLLRSVFTSVSSSAAVIVGIFADADLFDAAFLFLAGISVIATLCYFLLPESELY